MNLIRGFYHPPQLPFAVATPHNGFMCGRMTLTRAELGDVAAELEADLGVALTVPRQTHYRPRYNLAPTDEHFIVLPGQLAPARWGFRTRAQPLINARMETLDQRGLFRLLCAARPPRAAAAAWSPPTVFSSGSAPAATVTRSGTTARTASSSCLPASTPSTATAAWSSPSSPRRPIG